MKTTVGKAVVRGMVCAVLLGALAGCGTWSPNVSSEDKLCEEVAELDRVVTSLAALPDSATSGQVQQLKGELDRQYQAVQEAGQDVQSVRIDSVTGAYNSTVRATQAATSQGVAAAKPQLDQAASEMNQARTNINQSGGC